MTQCVQAPNQRIILREAWAAAMSRSPLTVPLGPAPPLNYRDEVRDLSCRRLTLDGGMRCKWPLYLSVTLPAGTPPEWRGIVGSRIMATLLPQLEVCGFFPRPLCADRPAFLVLLWPREALRLSSEQILITCFRVELAFSLIDFSDPPIGSIRTTAWRRSSVARRRRRSTTSYCPLKIDSCHAQAVPSEKTHKAWQQTDNLLGRKPGSVST